MKDIAPGSADAEGIGRTGRVQYFPPRPGVGAGARVGTCGIAGIDGKIIPFSTPGFGIGAVGSGDVGAVPLGIGMVGVPAGGVGIGVPGATGYETGIG
jgi:hypothetical protein